VPEPEVHATDSRVTRALTCYWSRCGEVLRAFYPGGPTGGGALLESSRAEVWEESVGRERAEEEMLTSLGACLRISRLARWLLGTLIVATIFVLLELAAAGGRRGRGWRYKP
jgi:hypothetical protein